MHGENEVVQLYLDDIIPNRFQPREVFDEKALKELAVSIKEHGVIQPIIVRNIGNKYEIIAGERRYKASALAGLTKIPAIVRNLDDKESSKVALLENLQRKNLNPIEEARTYQKILEIDQMTQEELAKTMGKSQGAVANKLRLLALTDAVQDALLKEQISERHARSLLNLQNPEEQKAMLKRVIDEKMTVRELEQELNPKAQELTKEDVRSLIQGVPDTVPMMTSTMTAPIKNDDAIDYSTPPKFIDYGLEDEEEDVEPGGSSAIAPPDINALRQNAQDINMNIKPTADLDSLLNVSAPKEEVKETPQESFKFLDPGYPSPTPETTSRQSSDDYFKTPDILTTPKQNSVLPPIDPFQIPSVQENNFAEPNLMNFQPNLGPTMPQTPSAPNSYTLQEAIEEIRSVVKKLEQAGVKVETDEMDFDRNYQVVIKFIKEENGK